MTTGDQPAADLRDAIIDYRENPSDESRQVLLDTQLRYVRFTYRTYADEYIARTTNPVC